MSFDFPAILTILVVFTGVVSLVDFIFRRIKASAKKTNQPIFVDYCRSFFPVLLIVLIIRSLSLLFYFEIVTISCYELFLCSCNF